LSAIKVLQLLVITCFLAAHPAVGAEKNHPALGSKLYNPENDARVVFDSELAAAIDSNRYLMVVFGADWCPDCLKLYDNLVSPDVASYMRDSMNFMTVDVGRKDRNIEFAEELGITVSNGIPVAVFFSPKGEVIGSTNNGELEPSRSFSSAQILRFVTTIVEYHRVTDPKQN
jgi:thiol:disulfide interchange protein